MESKRDIQIMRERERGGGREIWGIGREREMERDLYTDIER